MFFLIFSLVFQNELQPPDMVAALTSGDARQFEQLLIDGQRIDVDLRPVLPDYGKLSASQTGLSFRRLIEQYDIIEVEITSRQGDTNYSWLEFQIKAEMKGKQTGSVISASFLFQFKIKSGEIGMSRWIVQNVQ